MIIAMYHDINISHHSVCELLFAFISKQTFLQTKLLHRNLYFRIIHDSSFFKYHKTKRMIRVKKYFSYVCGEGIKNYDSTILEGRNNMREAVTFAMVNVWQ